MGNKKLIYVCILLWIITGISVEAAALVQVSQPFKESSGLISLGQEKIGFKYETVKKNSLLENEEPIKAQEKEEEKEQGIQSGRFRKPQDFSFLSFLLFNGGVIILILVLYRNIMK
ncbi:MAG: hypothetical protein AB2421_18125 [Thermotaleaceae bacterium]